MRNSYIALRQTLGLLGILLPFLVIGFGFLGNNRPQWYYSISATFYANSGPIFMMLMGAVGLFLICYGSGGYNSLLDVVINRLSGAFALIIVLFPCTVPGITHAGLLNLPIAVSNLIHCVAAAIFFGLLSFNIVILFTKSSKYLTYRKVKRNMLYKVCGYGILVFMAVETLMIILHVRWFTIIDETIMLWLFGIAWLVKGEAIRKMNDSVFSYTNTNGPKLD
jgi:hypothetical protein